MSTESIIPETVFIADGVKIIGRVSLGEHASVWYNSVLRGDINSITVGARTNIQDLSCLHVADEWPVVIGSDCVVGHQSTIHGATIGDRVLVGMGAIILNGAIVGDDCIVAAGSLIPERMVIPAGSLVIGIPAKIKRPVTDEEKQQTLHWAQKYAKLAEANRLKRIA